MDSTGATVGIFNFASCWSNSDLSEGEGVGVGEGLTGFDEVCGIVGAG